MKKLDEGQIALIVGGFMGFVHLLWALLVAFGLAQLYLDWILGLHFLNNPFVVGTFTLTNAVILVVATGVIGYVVGWVFAWIWNRAVRK